MHREEGNKKTNGKRIRGVCGGENVTCGLLNCDVL
jgi:hypothetical protein